MSKKVTQKDQNPYAFTDSNKRYYTYDYYLRRTFGGKCAKIPLDAGMTCPNIDGRCGVGGCIYCSGRGSGDFAESPLLGVGEQYRRMREKLSAKWSVERCIPYFQAHTNTYAPLERLRGLYEEALAQEGVVGLNIATRADCLGEGIPEYLAELADRTVLTVELGLQTTCDETAERINRGHTFAEFCRGYERLRRASDRIGICVHLIFGLPGEDRDTMLETVRRVAELHPDQVKLHLLHVLRGTALAEEYLAGRYTPMEKSEYVSVTVDALELLPSDTVIGRLTGDGMAEELLAPDWSRKKVSVINDIDKELYERGSYQGMLCKGDGRQ
ncbi:MAG: TIGR01212 family radical SAM protein [Ruminococcaceae bacterium]|nr:TIGR01212 family radical SAM protein [Oscillospiraceae bacterium]